jgi:hypothetical protein
MAASAHVLFDQPVMDKIHVNRGQHEGRVLPAPAGLLAHIGESRAERASEPLGHVMEGCTEVLVLEFDHVNEDQQEIFRILAHLGANRRGERRQIGFGQRILELGDGLSKPFGDQRAVLFHQAGEERFFAGVMSVNRCRGHTGPFGDFPVVGAVKALRGEQRESRRFNPPAFILTAIFEERGHFRNHSTPSN